MAPRRQAILLFLMARNAMSRVKNHDATFLVQMLLSHTFYNVHFVLRSTKLLFLLFFSKTNWVCKPLQVGSALIWWKSWPLAMTPIEVYTKERKVSNLLQSYLKGTATATSRDIWVFLPKISKIANNWGKRVKANRFGAGAKITFLNEYNCFAGNLVVCLIIPGKPLLPQTFHSLLRFLFSCRRFWPFF